MTSKNLVSAPSKYLPILNNATIQNSLAYKTTRLMASILNATQMTLAEAYINGLEIPDSVFRSMMQASMPILFKHAPSLLAPYEWVLTESDRLAESSRELMKVQYDLPQAMLNQMLGDWQIIYPKYSMALWEDGATDLESAQMQMIDKILSIGVFCHVGNLTDALQKLSSLLESDGKVFLHLITARIPNPMSSGFTHKYMFPHGRYWNYDAIPSHNRDLQTVDRWYLNGMNYHQTFRGKRRIRVQDVR